MSRAGRWLVIGLLGIAFTVGLSSPANAQTLYGAEAPPDAAYVRVFRAADGKPGESLTLGSTRFDVHILGRVTAYRPVYPDIYQIQVAGHSAEIIPQAERYYTVAVTGRGIQVFEDPAHTDQARAQLVLYNLSSVEGVGLRTEDGNTRVILPLGPGGVERITVNAVPVRLAVFTEDELLHGVGDPGLKRGSSYSAFVFDDNGSTAVLWSEATLALD